MTTRMYYLGLRAWLKTERRPEPATTFGHSNGHHTATPGTHIDRDRAAKMLRRARGGKLIAFRKIQ